MGYPSAFIFARSNDARNNMQIITTKIEGLYIIEPQIWNDSRGYFFESYQSQKFAELGIDDDFIQDNEAFSYRGVLRGLHYQLPPFKQAKLVRVVSGMVQDVAVDIRPGSPTYGEYVSIILSDENKRQFYVPQGFAHGYLTLSESAIFAYKCDQYYARDHEAGIRYNDPSLAIDWQMKDADLIVSEKDQNLPLFAHHEKIPVH